jgi:hypothetical protein
MTMMINMLFKLFSMIDDLRRLSDNHKDVSHDIFDVDFDFEN